MASTEKKVKVTWVKSQIGTKEPHRRTLRALGLRRRNDSRVHTVTPQIQGMIDSISYLVKVEEA